MELSIEYNMKAKNPLTSREILGTTELIAVELGSFVSSRRRTNGFGQFGGEGFIETLTY